MIALDIVTMDTGSALKPKHLRQKVKKCLCSWCARAKITRVSFQPREEPRSTVFGEFIVVDIAVYLNCPSMEGVRYVLQFTCVATKWFYSYGLVNRARNDGAMFEGFGRGSNDQISGGAQDPKVSC